VQHWARDRAQEAEDRDGVLIALGRTDEARPRVTVSLPQKAAFGRRLID
jgi:hypothetical protein